MREKNERLQELFDKGIPVYSYSKLDSWHSCKYNWYQSYILHKRSKDNIYSSIGSVIHDSLESLYVKNEPLNIAKIKFNEVVKECESKGIKFPENPPTTKINYLKNMNHFFDNYKKMDVLMKTEQFILLKLPRKEGATKDEDFIWIQMYIDSIIPEIDDENNIKAFIVNDWKTSSKFDKDKLKKASKQLLVYKLGLEQQIGVNVSTVGWTMLKYVYCCYKTKGSKKTPSQVKKSMQERKDSVKWFHKKIVSDLINCGMDTIEAELLMGKAINKNDLSLLPQEIQNKYWIEDCFLEYEATKEEIEGCKDWIINTVKEIEETENKVKNYPPIEIGDKTSYFCFNLCGRPDCIHLMKYKNDNIDNFKKKKTEDAINNTTADKKKFNLDNLFK